MTYRDRQERRRREHQQFDRQYRLVGVLVILGLTVTVALAVTGVIPWAALFAE